MTNSEELSRLVDEELEFCKSLLIGKAKEYASDTDRLHNFRTASGISGKTMRDSLAGMMLKHTVSVYDMCFKNKEYELDIWKEKITDHINYLLLLWAILNEKK